MTGPSARKPAALSPRQTEIVDWLRLGLTQKEIAAELEISDRTVEEQLRRARQRLGVASTFALLARVRARPRPVRRAVRDSHDVENPDYR